MDKIRKPGGAAREWQTRAVQPEKDPTMETYQLVMSILALAAGPVGRPEISRLTAALVDSLGLDGDPRLMLAHLIGAGPQYATLAASFARAVEIAPPVAAPVPEAVAAPAPGPNPAAPAAPGAPPATPRSGIFRRHGNEWCVEILGGTVTPGTTARVTKRDGSVDTVRLTSHVTGALWAFERDKPSRAPRSNARSTSKRTDGVKRGTCRSCGNACNPRFLDCWDCKVAADEDMGIYR